MADQRGDPNGQPVDQQQHYRYSSTRFESETTFKHYEDETRFYSAYEDAARQALKRRATDDDHDDHGYGEEAENTRRGQRLHQPQTKMTSATLPSGSSLGEPTASTATNGALPTSPQRVRLVEGEIQQQRRCRPASADRFGSSSQRASRSSLGGAHSATRMGRFVNYYPASRQQSPSRRQPSPYAFHVPPPNHQRNNHHYQHQVARTSACGNSRATSPSYAYANFNANSVADDYSQACYFQEQPPANHDNNQQHQLAEWELHNNSQAQQHEPSQLTTPSHPRQSRYGYVAPLDRIPATGSPAYKFNKSLRSRTISHLPSMVQVTVDDPDTYATATTATANGKSSLFNPTTSESDLLRRHVVVWRSNAELDHDNPFKPGSQLSWEADLMVRLIKRGYPIDQLPSLVEAAKLEAAARQHKQQQQRQQSTASKSCDRLAERQEPRRTERPSDLLTQNSGFLRSNLRQANQARELTITGTGNQRQRPISSAVSHSNLQASKTMMNGQTREMTDQGQHEQPTPNDCKTIWADSLRRAKSVPRFHQTDADSLDKLITSIEMEIGHMLEEAASPVKDDPDRGQEMTESEKVLEGREVVSARSSPVRKQKVASSPSPARQQPAKSKPGNGNKRAQQQQNMKTTAKSPNSEPNVMTKSVSMSGAIGRKKTSQDGGKREKKKPKCCSIQ